jgi:hypothetical protein
LCGTETETLFLISSAIISLQFVLLHIMLSVIAFDAFARNSYKWIAFVVAAHLMASFSVLFLSHIFCLTNPRNENFISLLFCRLCSIRREDLVF